MSSPLPMIVAVFFIMYFLVIRPQKKEQDAHQQLLASLQKGDRVVTASGIHGEIHEVSEREVVLEVADKVRLTLDKDTVRRKKEK